MIQSFFAQQITFPIQKAIQAFEQIKRTQDYSIRLEINQKDEFSKLAISINELLDYIEKEKNRDQEKQKILQAQAEKDGQITLGFLDIDHFKDFNTYLEQLLLVGACGNEDWQMLPFCLDAQSGIVSDCENAKEYRKLIGLQI